MSKKAKQFKKSERSNATGETSQSFDFEADNHNRFEAKAERVRKEKRTKFVQASQSSKKSGFPVLYAGIGVALIVIVAAVVFLQSKPSADVNAAGSNTIREVTIQPTVANGKISIPVEEVRKNKLVAFDFQSGGKKVPLTAWVAPSGAIKTAIRMCEPCNSTSFHIEGNQLVCNTCGTRWDLESEKGISGGCTNYPPEPLPSVVDGDNVIIDQGPVLTWKPRV